MRVQYFDPKTGRLLRQPLSPAGIPLSPPPMQSRRRAFRGFGDTPNASGAAGPLMDPYNEQGIWNPPATNNGGSDGGFVPPGTPLPNDSDGTGITPAATPSPAQQGRLPISSPYGESDRTWTNPTTFATIPINQHTNITVPVVSQNYQRNALLIQNLSTATLPDTAPTLYIGFNAQPQIGSALGLLPGQGIAFDIITPRDSIFVGFGPFVDTGGSTIVQGSVVVGTYSPHGPPQYVIYGN